MNPMKLSVVTKTRNHPKPPKTTQNDPKPPTKPPKTTNKTTQNHLQNQQNQPKRPKTSYNIPKYDQFAWYLRRWPSVMLCDYHVDNNAWNFLALIVFFALKLFKALITKSQSVLSRWTIGTADIFLRGSNWCTQSKLTINFSIWRIVTC